MASEIEPEIKEFDEVLRSADLLVDESVQVYELESEKSSVVDELYNSLKTITEFLGFSVDLSPSILHEAEDTKITLTPSLDIVIRKSNGKIQQKRLDEFSTKKIAAILKNSIMPIIELCKNEKIIQNQNITFLKAVTNKLDKIQKINEGISRGEEKSLSGKPDVGMNQKIENQSGAGTSKTPEVS